MPIHISLQMVLDRIWKAYELASSLPVKGTLPANTDYTPWFLAAERKWEESHPDQKVFPRWRCVGCAVTDLPVPLICRSSAFGPAGAGIPARRKPLRLMELLCPVREDEMQSRGSSYTKYPAASAHVWSGLQTKPICVPFFFLGCNPSGLFHFLFRPWQFWALLKGQQDMPTIGSQSLLTSHCISDCEAVSPYHYYYYYLFVRKPIAH